MTTIKQPVRSSVLSPHDYWEARLQAHFDLRGVGHESFGQLYNAWLYRVRGHIFSRIVNSANINPRQAEVMDIGSGTGFYIEQWKNADVQRVVGVDITHTAVARLRERWPGTAFYQLDIGEDIECGVYGVFDVVSAFDVLYHITDDERFATAIRNVYKLLKPGGWFILSDNFVHTRDCRAERQVSRSLVRIENVLSQSGFDSFRRRPMFVLMNYPVDCQSRQTQKLWKGLATLAMSSELLGAITGAVLYPVELALTRLFIESPTTEVMVCRRC